MDWHAILVNLGYLSAVVIICAITIYVMDKLGDPDD